MTALLSDLLSDLRYALRSLSKSPGFAVAVVSTLALGIGANTAVYSLVRGVLLRSLPFPAPERLVSIRESLPEKGFATMVASPPNYLDWKAQTRSFTAMGAYTTQDLALSEGGEPERLRATLVTTGFFEALAVVPLRGRTFTDAETVSGSDREAVLSHGVWVRRFGGDPQIVGKTVRLDGDPYAVIGIMPPGFRFPEDGPDVWVPLAFRADVATQRGAHYLSVVARRKPGVTLARADADIAAVASRLAQQYPNTNRGHRASVVELRESLVGSVRQSLWMLLGAVAFVTLIACANVASLLLTRSAHRAPEMAIRTALGAGRSRIARQLLTETVVLAVGGAALGTALAGSAVDAIVRFGPADIPRLAEIRLDGGALLFTAAWTIFAAVVCGLAPLAGALRRAPMSSLKAAGADASARPGPVRLRRILVVGEISLALLLLAGAGLLVRSLARLSAVDPGFAPGSVLRFDLALPESRYPDDAHLAAFTDQLLAQMRRIPGVRSAGATFGLPLTQFSFHSTFRVDGRPVDPANEPSAQLRVASRDYFGTVRIPLLAGRLFAASDRLGSPSAILASRRAAAKFWPAGDAIGQRLRFGARSGNARIEGEIVGIVGDIHDEGLSKDLVPEFYASLEQAPTAIFSVVLRAADTGPALVSAVRREIRSLDPSLPVADLETMDSVVSRSIAGPRFTMLLLLVFACAAVLLSAVGVYSVIAYSVAQRTREIGIRMALGADARRVRELVLRDGFRLAIAGLAIGLPAALALTRVMRGLLFEIPPTDLATYAAVVLILMAVALLACWIPARRAARMDPLNALRGE